jgi:nitrite reductase/ring-hydroxylating ferredoxin subunit
MIQLCMLDDIEEGRAKGFDIGNKSLFAVRKDDQLHVYYNCCPHLGTPLEWLEDEFMDPDGAFIQCATHGALFNIEDGLCIHGPCKGKSLRPIPYETGNGMLFVDETVLQSLGRI